MQHIKYKPTGVCSYGIEFDLDEEKNIHNLVFSGGCNGNLKAIGKLCEGKDAESVSTLLEGVKCGGKSTSCADQLSLAIKKAIKE